MWNNFFRPSQRATNKSKIENIYSLVLVTSLLLFNTYSLVLVTSLLLFNTYSLVLVTSLLLFNTYSLVLVTSLLLLLNSLLKGVQRVHDIKTTKKQL